MKTKFKAYKLHFQGPLHLGDERDDYSVSLKTYQSDAMYAAITASLAKLGTDIPDGGDLGFTISSLFPFYQKSENDNPIFFFPKPLKQKIPELKDVKNAKKVKKAAWFDKDYFEILISGQDLFKDENIINSLDGEFLSRRSFDHEFIKSQVSPRVTVSRDQSEDARPFYMDRIYFKGTSGLFFFVDGETELLDKAMNLLQHEGIGTDRNIGNGYFTFKTEEIEMDIPESNYCMNLSMFWPENSEQLKPMLEGEIAYDFQKRGGWISTSPYNTYRKNSAHMFLPGSVFKTPNNLSKPNILGKIGDLKPQSLKDVIKHPIYRNGKSIFIPIKI
jgi:CRISPR-associated protein Csm4